MLEAELNLPITLFQSVSKFQKFALICSNKKEKIKILITI